MERVPQDHLSQDSAERGAGHQHCIDEADDFRNSVQAADARFAQLARAIEQEIIPRLMLAHRVAPERANDAAAALRLAPAAEAIGPRDVVHFAKLVLCPDDDMALSFIATLRSRGAGIERVYLDLLAPTARYLGDLWSQDLCSFTDVTLAVGRLQRVLRELSPSFGSTVDQPADGRRVLLLPGPGEQHTFGLVMVAEFFRRADWDVTGGAWCAGADAPKMVRTEWFDVLGFSLAAEVNLPALGECIRASRHAACNRQLAIMVGGPMFTAHPEYVGQVGADGMAADGSKAPSLAESLIVQRGGH
jgi:methanogenic corrinoid protein MtbC1